MRHAPLEFAAQIEKLKSQGETWDTIVCTDMLDVAAFKGLADVSGIPLTVYFHENQFAYPTRDDWRSTLHFQFTNFTTMVAADRVWFNSHGARGLLKRFPDFKPIDRIDEIREKSSVQYPGVDVPPQSEFPQPTPLSSPVVITWAARWEHDKGPDELEAFLSALTEAAIDFRINVIGQSYKNQPPAFERIKQSFGDRIDAWGFQTIERFQEIIDATDVILSTANHEFFGLSVVEAIARGAMPLLPNRLAYPEVIGAMCDGDDVSQFLYNDLDDAVKKLKAFASISTERRTGIISNCRRLFNWETRAAAMDEAL